MGLITLILLTTILNGDAADTGHGNITTGDGTLFGTPTYRPSSSYFRNDVRPIVYHMEEDKLIPGAIVISYGYSLKWAFFNNHDTSTTIVGGEDKRGDQDNYCEQIEGYSRYCSEYPFVSCKYSDCESSSSSNTNAVRFRRITGFHQITPHHIVVVDNGNNCLRMVHRPSVSGQTYTYPYLGLCDKGADKFQDSGRSTHVRFAGPWSVVPVPGSPNLLVTDSGNDALRFVKLDSETFQPLRVSTVSHIKLNNPTAMSWNFDNSKLHISNFHFISEIKFDEEGNTKQSVVCGTALPGDGTGNLTDAKFEQPIGLQHITENILVVADYYNARVKIIDQMNGEVQAINLTSVHREHPDRYGHGHSELSQLKPVSLLMVNNTLLVGGSKNFVTIKVNSTNNNTKPDADFKLRLKFVEKGKSLSYSKGGLPANFKCPEPHQEVVNPVTRTAHVKLPVGGMVQTLELPVGNYSYTIAYMNEDGESVNCSLSVTIYDHRIKRRIDFQAAYDVECSDIDDKHSTQGIHSVVRQSAPQINEVCNKACKVSIDEAPSITCTNDTLLVTWPTDQVYNGSVISVPQDVCNNITSQLQNRLSIAPITVIKAGNSCETCEIPDLRIVYPRLGNNGLALEFQLTSFCELEKNQTLHVDLKTFSCPN